MKTLIVFALLGALAAPVLAGEAFKGFECTNECPLAKTANSHRANGTEALAAQSVVRADVAARVEKNLAKIEACEHFLGAGVVRSEAASAPFPSTIGVNPMHAMTKNWFRRLAVLPALLLTVALASAQEVDKAIGALKAGEWMKSIEIASMVTADSPEYARAQYVCGEAFLVLGDAKLSEASFRRVLAKNAMATPALIGLGRALTMAAKYPEAEETLMQAVKLDAKDPLAILALGQAHLAMKKTKEAKAEIGAAYALEPTNPLVVKGWCEWLFAENDNMKALKVAGDLSKSQPKHPLGPFLEGIAFERDGKDKKAIAAYEEALKRDANFLDAHKNLAIICHTQNPMYTDEARTKKALEHYERYFALGGKDPELETAYKQFKGFYEEYMGGGKKK